MKSDSKLAKKIETGDFIFTAEHQPRVSANGSAAEKSLKSLGNGLAAVNVSDNHHGTAMSSLAGSMAVIKSGAEPIYQAVKSFF